MKPEENEQRQELRSAKRERAKEARTVAILAALLKIEGAVLDSADPVRSRELSSHEAIVAAKQLLANAS